MANRPVHVLISCAPNTDSRVHRKRCSDKVIQEVISRSHPHRSTHDCVIWLYLVLWGEGTDEYYYCMPLSCLVSVICTNECFLRAHIPEQSTYIAAASHFQCRKPEVGYVKTPSLEPGETYFLCCNTLILASSDFPSFPFHSIPPPSLVLFRFIPLTCPCCISSAVWRLGDPT